MNKKNDDSSQEHDVIKKIEQSLQDLPSRMTKIQENCTNAHLPLNCFVNQGSNLVVFLEELRLIGKKLANDKKNPKETVGHVHMKLKDCARFERSADNPLQVWMTFDKKDDEKAAASCFDAYQKTWDIHFMKEDKRWLVTFPALTLDRRQLLVKKSNEIHERFKAEINDYRQEVRDSIKKLKQKDQSVKMEKKLQDVIDKMQKDLEAFVKKIQDRLLKM